MRVFCRVQEALTYARSHISASITVELMAKAAHLILNGRLEETRQPRIFHCAMRHGERSVQDLRAAALHALVLSA
jgi:hypothetical protein